MRVALGLLHKTTREIVRKARAIRNAGLENEARALARHVKPSSLKIADDIGYVAFQCAKLGIGDEIRRIAALSRGWTMDPSRSDSDKPFLRNILQPEDLFNHPEIMKVATHDEFFGAVTEYLGQVPWLVSLQVWWTPPNNTAIRSQLYHYDHRDTRQAKIFINLDTVDEQAGPLHFVPASASDKVNRNVGYSQNDYTDREVETAIQPEEIIRTVGPPGAGYIVDTARCLHYGSRKNTKDRLILMISYARVNCVSKGAGCEVLDQVRQKLTATYYNNDAARAFANRKP